MKNPMRKNVEKTNTNGCATEHEPFPTTTPSGVPYNAEGPRLPFEIPFKCELSQDVFWQQEGSSTLLIGDGDLTALALMFAQNSAWGNKTPFLNAYAKGVPILFFKSSPIPWIPNFFAVLCQLNPPSLGKPPRKSRINKEYIAANQPEEEMLYPLKVQVYPPENYMGFSKEKNNFTWLVYPTFESCRPWEPYFIKELKRMTCRPKIVFCDGWCNDFSQLLKDDILELGKWIAEMKSMEIGVVLTASVDLKTKRFFRLFDNVIESQLWRKQKCSDRNLTVTLSKLAGRHFNFPIKYHIKSPQDEIAWQEVGKRYDTLRPIIAALTEAEFTAQQQIELLRIRYKTSISLPMLAKLKRDWGIRTYRPTKKGRKTTPTDNEV